MAEVQTIDDLKALVTNKGGVARGNVFAVSLPPLAGLKKSRTKSIMFKCKFAR